MGSVEAERFAVPNKTIIPYLNNWWIQSVWEFDWDDIDRVSSALTASKKCEIPDIPEFAEKVWHSWHSWVSRKGVKFLTFLISPKRCDIPELCSRKGVKFLTNARETALNHFPILTDEQRRISRLSKVHTNRFSWPGPARFGLMRP